MSDAPERRGVGSGRVRLTEHDITSDSGLMHVLDLIDDPVPT